MILLELQSIRKLVASKGDVLFDPYRDILGAYFGLLRIEKHIERRKFMDRVLVLKQGGIDIEFSQFF